MVMIATRMKSAPWQVGTAVFLASFTLYLATLAPSLSWGWDGKAVDGGELLAAANTLGVPHPPGYPTYMLLLKGFATLAPVGDMAYRGNLLSALLASASVVTVYLAALRFCRRVNPNVPRGIAVASAALGALVFATSPLLWSQATVTEVYTLNALFVGLLLLIASDLALGGSTSPPRTARAAPSTGPKLALFGFLLGIGLGNHLTLLALAVPLVYWMWSTLGWRRLAHLRTLGPFVAGIAVYAYLPLSAAQDPPVSWGDADTLVGFVWMLTGRPYQEYVFGVPVESLLFRFKLWASLAYSQFNPLGLFLGLMAVAPLRSTAPRFLYSILGAIAVLSVYALTYSTVDFEVLMIPAFLVFSVWVAVGFFWIATTWVQVEETGVDVSPNGHGRPRASVQAVVLVVLAFLLLPAVSVALNYGSKDLRDDSAAHSYAGNVMDTVPDGSVVLSNGEKSVFSLWYMRYVERPERDVAVIAVPLLQFDWYLQDVNRMFPDRVPQMSGVDDVEAVTRIVAHNDGGAGVYFTFTNRALADAYELDQLGTVFRATAK